MISHASADTRMRAYSYSQTTSYFYLFTVCSCTWQELTMLLPWLAWHHFWLTVLLDLRLARVSWFSA